MAQLKIIVEDGQVKEITVDGQRLFVHEVNIHMINNEVRCTLTIDNPDIVYDGSGEVTKERRRSLLTGEWHTVEKP